MCFLCHGQFFAWADIVHMASVTSSYPTPSSLHVYHPRSNQQIHRVEVGSNISCTARQMSLCCRREDCIARSRRDCSTGPQGCGTQYMVAPGTTPHPSPSPPQTQTLHDESQSFATNATGLPCTVVLPLVVSPPYQPSVLQISPLNQAGCNGSMPHHPVEYCCQCSAGANQPGLQGFPFQEPPSASPGPRK